MRAALEAFSPLRALAAAVAMTAPIDAVRAADDAKPSLAQYDCTRAADDSKAAGDQLAAEGYEIATRARFGDINLMMINPKTDAIANCFKRQEGRN